MLYLASFVGCTSTDVILIQGRLKQDEYDVSLSDLMVAQTVDDVIDTMRASKEKTPKMEEGNYNRFTKSIYIGENRAKWVSGV